MVNVKDGTGRLARWALFIRQFDFKVKHRPGMANAMLTVYHVALTILHI